MTMLPSRALFYAGWWSPRAVPCVSCIFCGWATVYMSAIAGWWDVQFLSGGIVENTTVQKMSSHWCTCLNM
jgi:hypothetical protein